MLISFVQFANVQGKRTYLYLSRILIKNPSVPWNLRGHKLYVQNSKAKLTTIYNILGINVTALSPNDSMSKSKKELVNVH